MPEKYRGTQGSGRKHKNGKSFSKEHNRRDFDILSADNIDQSLTSKNVYWDIEKDTLYREIEKDSYRTFDEVNLDYCKKHFTKQYQEQMEKYRAKGNYDRCRTFEEWIDKKRPEQVWLQIGNREKQPDAKLLIKAFISYREKLMKWNAEHGYIFDITNFALHLDESTPHFHMDRIWHYTENGVEKIGQEKALLQAGIQPPDPTKKISRYNNPKMTFDAMAREMWLDSCEEVGIEMEREPLPNGHRHKEKEDFIKQKYVGLIDESLELQRYNQLLQEKNHRLKQENQILLHKYKELDDEMAQFAKDKIDFETYRASESKVLESEHKKTLKIQQEASNKLHIIMQLYNKLLELHNKLTQHDELYLKYAQDYGKQLGSLKREIDGLSL